jgi:hypothetical protein
MARTGRPETPIGLRLLQKTIRDPQTGCWLWTGARCRQGYGFIKRKDGAQLRAHRVAYELCCGPISPGLMVCHHCDDPRCVRPAHLFLGTAQINADDMVAKGRSARNLGERNGYARLTREQVLQIREADDTHNSLAKQFGVSATLIGLIKRRLRWKHV